MELTLSNLKAGFKQRRQKRVGRGNASGKGTYSGRGRKGQKSRSGGRQKSQPRGLRLLLARQLPKQRGFTSLGVKQPVVNIGTLEANFQEGEHITLFSLKTKGLISATSRSVKILGSVARKKLIVEANAFSKGAFSAINKAGGKAIVINSKS